MKLLRLTHALTGLLVLALVLSDLFGAFQVGNIPADVKSPVTLLLLFAASANISVGTYDAYYYGWKRLIGTFASLALILALALAYLFTFDTHQKLFGYGFDIIATNMLVLAVLGLFILNLDTFPAEKHYFDSGRETGTVKWFNVTKGYGFITRDAGGDVFVHYRAIRGEGHRVLTEGQRVEFEIIDKEKGQQAEDVIAAPKGR